METQAASDTKAENRGQFPLNGASLDSPNGGA